MKELLSPRVLAGLALPFAVASLQPLLAQAAWTRLYPATSPPRLADHAMAFDAARGVAVLFGGRDPVGFHAQTWTWNGTDWQSVSAGGPSARSSHGMAFDARRSRVVLFGGIDASSSPRDDTWEWDGTTWLRRTSATSPTGRVNAAMAFDPDSGNVLLFGGENYPTSYDDLWSWDGLDWNPLATTGPSRRHGAGFAFDPTTCTMLLFGGNDRNFRLDDTWSWNGTSWSRRFPATTPYPRMHHAMATDEARSRVVLQGGFDGDPFLWEWDGTNWQPRLIASPAPRQLLGLAYDSHRREVVSFGGDLFGGRGQQDDTWVYRTAQPASFTAYGQGCPGSLGTPQLANVPYRLPWLGDALATQVTGVPATPVAAVAFVTGLRATPPLSLSLLGLPGCSSFLSLDDVLLTFATNGTATRTIPIPNAPQLAGAHLFQQALVFDGAAPGGAVVSNAGEAILGIR